MFNNSAMYGLRNPGFTDDIGFSLLNPMRSMPMNYPIQVFSPMMNSGLLNRDIYQPSNEKQMHKNRSALKKIFFGGLAATTTLLLGFGILKSAKGLLGIGKNAAKTAETGAAAATATAAEAAAEAGAAASSAEAISGNKGKSILKSVKNFFSKIIKMKK